MADLNARIKPKKSSTTGEVPQAADLEVAEIAVNTADGKLFVKHTDNSIKEISGGTDITTESIDALSDVDTTTTPPTDGQALTWVDANSQWEPADMALDDLTDVDTTNVPPAEGQVLGYTGSIVQGDVIWTLEGGVLQDESVNGLTINNSNATIASDGKVGDCLDFSTASNAHAYIDDNSLLQLPGDFTIEFDFKYTTGGSSSEIIFFAKNNTTFPSSTSYKAYLDASGFIWLVMSNGTSNLGVANPSFGTRTENTWYHVAFVRSGDNIAIYKDGTLISNPASSFSGSPNVTNAPLRFGCDQTLTSGDFKMDNFRLINSALYTSNFTPTSGVISPTYPTGWYPVDVSSGSSVAAIDDLTDVDTTTVAPTDGQALIWDNTASQWSPESVSVESLSNYVPPTEAPSYYFTGTLDPLTPISDPNDYKGVDGAGANDYFAYLSTNTEAHALISIAQIGEAVTFTWDSGEVFTSTVDTVPAVNSGAEYFMRVTGFIFAGTIPTGPMRIAFPDRTAVDRDPVSGEALVYGSSGWTPVALDIDSLSDVDTATTAPTDGQVLTWDNANSQWEPADLQGAAIRTALGIGEYVDDAAAGTGGVASGAMYYNTTSSDYRLKT